MTIHGYLNGPRFITALIVGEGPPKQLFILFILFLFILSYFIVFSISLCHCLTVEASLRRRIHDLDLATCIEIPVLQVQLKGHWIKLDKLSNLFSFKDTYSYLT